MQKFEKFEKYILKKYLQNLFRDQSELAANIAIGLASIDWVGVPLALVWYQWGSKYPKIKKC